MQETVRQQHRELGHQTVSGGLGLTPRRGDAHHDVSEKTIGPIAELALVLREGENVRRPILLAIDPVELLDLIVAREQNRQLTVFHLNRDQHGPRAAHDVDA